MLVWQGPSHAAPSRCRLFPLLAAFAVAAIWTFAAPTGASAATYVGMGDSYSSGTGTRDYYHAGCERSVHAYPELIKSSLGGTFSFTACGGAKTQDVTANQLGPLDANTQYATISIGGNDAGFSSVITECAKPLTNCSDEISAAQSFIQNTLPARLDSVYSAIRGRAPNAVVGVVGYPRLFNGTDCNAGTFFSGAEMTSLNQTADILAGVTRGRAQAHGLTFVDSRNAFLGHAVCDNPEWLNGLSNPTSESYHPNTLGHQGYAGIVRAALQAAPSPTAPSGGNGRIAFTSNRTGNDEVFVVNRTGSFPVNLTNNSAADTDPAWSPDGTKVAFASNRDGDNEIYVIDGDGGGLVKLTSNTADDRDPAWSPNGARIAFRSDRTGNNEVFRMTATGGSQTNLTNHSASDFAPDWSPDGSEIAFQRFTSGSGTGLGNEVFKMSADGQGKANLTNNSSATNDGQPSWAPSGNTIAFHSNRDGDFEIFTMGQAGGTATQRTTNNASDQQPTYAPSGTQLAINTNRDGNNEIYTMTSSGGSQTNRTNSSGSDVNPSWQADGTPPQTTISSGPGAVTNDATPTFEFASSELGATFQCRVDGSSFQTCSSPHTAQSLGDGQHTFEVRSTDEAANADSTPADWTFRVDTTPPETAIDAAPAALGNDNRPSFEFSSEQGAGFECRLDDGEWEGCTSPHSLAELADGEHRFEVRATDEAGNTDPSPAGHTFAVDTEAPETSLDSAPAELSNDPAPSFEFSSEAGASFECRLDGGEWNDCASPLSTGTLDDGSHSFEVRAIDAAGNRDESPASREFTIDATAPEIELDCPASVLLRAEATALVTATDGLSGLAAGEDPSGRHELDTSQAGSHRFAVEATDRAGNSATADCEYEVRYDFGGVRQPVNSNGESVFKLGSTVPVKFALADATGAPIAGAAAKLSLAKLTGGVAGDDREAVSTSAATSGNRFRYAAEDSQYIFNLATKGLSEGTYRLKISIDDGTVHTVRIGLR